MSLAFSTVLIDPMLKGPSFHLHAVIYSLCKETRVLTIEKIPSHKLIKLVPLRALLLKRSILLPKEGKGLINLQILLQHIIYYLGKYQALMNLKKLSYGKFTYLFIELVSRRI